MARFSCLQSNTPSAFAQARPTPQHSEVTGASSVADSPACIYSNSCLAHSSQDGGHQQRLALLNLGQRCLSEPDHPSDSRLPTGRGLRAELASAPGALEEL